MKDATRLIHENERFLNVREAAAYLAISNMMMYRLVKIPTKKGGPPARRFGKHIRFSRRKFLEWAEGKD